MASCGNAGGLLSISFGVGGRRALGNSFVGLDPDVTEVFLVGAGDDSLDVTGSKIGGLGLAVDELSVSTSVIGDAEGASGDISEGGVTVVGYKETLLNC